VKEEPAVCAVVNEVEDGEMTSERGQLGKKGVK
jgi:hypothetical protein